MQSRLPVVLWTAALSLMLISIANAQGEISKEEGARLTNLFEPWGSWAPLIYTPAKDTDELQLAVRKDPKPADSRIPPELRDRVTHATFVDKLADPDIDSFFATFPKINSIMVAKLAWSPRIGIKAAELKGIKDLWVSECDLAPDDLKAIGKMESLEVLMLSGNKRIGPALDSLSNLTQLRQLSLSGVPVPEFKKIRWLAYNVNLTSLRLTGTGIGDEAVPTLKALPKLTFVITDDTTSPKRQEELDESVRKKSTEQSRRRTQIPQNR